MAEKEKLERLKAKRGGNRAAVTKKLNEEKELLDGLQQNQEAAETHKSHSKVVRQFLEQKQKILHEYDEQILDLCQVANIEKEIDEADELHAKINDMLNKITDTLSILPKTSATSQASVSAVGLQQAKSTTVIPKLPKLTLEKFKGEVTTFQSFWDSGTHLILR